MKERGAQLRVFLVDDEPLALRRLERLLKATGRVDIVGSTTDPEAAIEFLSKPDRVDALFLDIQMPEVNGFELLARLEAQPLIVFTTAYDEYALRAFGENSIDYLLKPVESEQLERALKKLERLRGSKQGPELGEAIEKLAAVLRAPAPDYPRRIASRAGDRVQFVELARVTHFLARDKLTYAVTPEKSYVVDSTISDLEHKLDPRRFIRIHRSILLNLDQVQEVRASIGGAVVRLKDANRTELQVARDRIRALKQRLAF